MMPFMKIIFFSDFRESNFTKTFEKLVSQENTCMRITVKRPAAKIASNILHGWTFCPSIFTKIVSSTRIATIIKTFELITTDEHNCRFVNYKITKNRKNCEVNITEFLSPKVKKCRPNIHGLLLFYFFS